MDHLAKMQDSAFQPHGYCYLWNGQLLAIHVTADLLIGLSYIAIGAGLAYLVHRARRDIPFGWIVLSFGLFIVACGATHFMEIWTLWHPDYWLSGWVKVVTAAASVSTAIALPVSMPRILKVVDRARETTAAMASLRESEARFAGAFEHSAIGKALVGLDGRFLRVNRALCEILGYSADELLLRRFQDSTHPDDLPANLAHFEALLSGKQESYQMEKRHIRKDGQIVWVRVSETLVRNDSGEPIFFICEKQDVTARRAAEDALAVSEERFRTALNASFESFMTLAAVRDEAGDITDFVITEMNARAEDLTGEKREMAMGRRVSELFPDSRNRLLLYQAVVDTRQPHYGEHRLNDPRMKATWVEIHVVPWGDGVAVLSRDISERRETTNALRESEQRFRTVARASQSMVYEWNLETGEQYRSDSPFGCLGFDKDRKGMDRWGCEEIHPDDRTAAGIIEHALNNGDTMFSAEYRYRRADGSYVWVHDRGFIARAEDGTPIRIMGTATDITNRRDLENRLHQSRKMEAVGRLAGGIAHDFNNILTAIRSFGELLRDSLPPGDSRRSDADEIVRATELGAALTRQLLAFGRRQILRPETVQVEQIMEKLEPLLRRLLPKSITLVRINDPALKTVMADPGELEQVVLNLTLNARDAMPDGGAVTVRLENATLASEQPAVGVSIPAGDYLRILVRDTGHGIDPNDISRIFEPFFTKKPENEGTGLGLSTVLRIVEQSHGYVAVSSAAGVGTEIAVYLPAVAASEGTSMTPVPAVSDEVHTILLVDDEDGIRSSLGRYLRRHGYRVLEGRSGRDALEVAAAESANIDLLITDLMMPEMNGTQLAARMSEIRPETRVIFMSGYASDNAVRTGPADGVSGFVHKPFSLADVLKTIREVLGQTAALGANKPG